MSALGLALQAADGSPAVDGEYLAGHVRRIAHEPAASQDSRDSIELALSDPEAASEVVRHLGARPVLRIHYARVCTMFSLISAFLQP